VDNITQFEQFDAPHNSTARLDGVVIGVLLGFAPDGAPLVDFPGNRRDGAVASRATVALSLDEIGREVALLFEGGDPTQPLLIGAIVHPERKASPRVSVYRDGERLEFTARHEIALRCGAASITLTRAGKVLIRGAYVSSRSSGVNRIKGGAVHIN
jgi:uncharacterized protein DUF6484